MPPAERKDRGRPFLLAVAQHRRNKNLALLIEAFAELRRDTQSARDLELVIVGGEGPETASLRTLVQRHSLADRVVFTSHVADENMAWLYRHCAMLVVPSTIEGFCLPVAEALSCGAPVLCSDIPILREVGGDKCHYFPLRGPGTARALAVAISSLLRQPRLSSDPDDRFAPERIAAEHVSLYAKLLPHEQGLTVRVPRTQALPYDKRAS
jgi:glycosyltransferase involved in cell wall biosynthesis